MTIEEARDILQDQIDRYGEEYDTEGIEALEVAIEALSSWAKYSDELWKKAYARGYNDAKIQIAESGEYERIYQRGYEDGRKREWTAVAESEE